MIGCVPQSHLVVSGAPLVFPHLGEPVKAEKCCWAPGSGSVAQRGATEIHGG